MVRAEKSERQLGHLAEPRGGWSDDDGGDGAPFVETADWRSTRWRHGRQKRPLHGLLPHPKGSSMYSLGYYMMVLEGSRAFYNIYFFFGG